MDALGVIGGGHILTAPRVFMTRRVRTCYLHFACVIEHVGRKAMAASLGDFVLSEREEYASFADGFYRGAVFFDDFQFPNLCLKRIVRSMKK